jgi:RNA polymerase sigma factor (sigma-70 family)
MSDQSLNASIRSVLLGIKVREIEGLSDTELLGRYIESRDEVAFTVLVGRHGPTVLGVCRRVLRADDVDDAFQGTFLTLAKHAASIRRRSAVGSWLYEVAYHIALRARSDQVRNRRVEQSAASAEAVIPADELGDRELQKVFDEELHRLPERLRRALVLVHLLDKRQVIAARELGITDRALRKRLRVGQERLQRGLSRRGVGLTVAALASFNRPVMAGLIRPTVKSALAYAAGETTGVTAAAMTLAAVGSGGVFSTGKVALMGSLLAISLLVGAGLTARGIASRPATAPDLLTQTASKISAPNDILDESKTIVTGRVLDSDGRPAAHAGVTALVRRPWQSADRGLHHEIVARGVADADGRYRLALRAMVLTGSTERRLTLLAHAPGQAPTTEVIALREGENSADVRLAARTTISGQLLAPGGTPATGVRLGVIRLGSAHWDGSSAAQVNADSPVQPPTGWPAETTTDATGVFRLEGVPAGANLWLQVRDERYALSAFRATTANADSSPITLAGPRVLSGRITAADTNRPLAGSRIAVIVGPDRTAFDYYAALGASPEVVAAVPPTEIVARADANGQYRLRLPPGKEYQVYVYPPDGGVFLGWQGKLTWDQGDTTRERSVALTPGVEVIGRVIEEDDRPICAATVIWTADAPGTTAPVIPASGSDNFPDSQTPALVFSDAATLTAADGRFRLVVSAKPVVLRVYGPTADYRLDNYDYERCLQCGKVHLRPGEHARIKYDPTAVDRDKTIQVRLRRGQTVSGRAVDANGQPIPDGVLVCRNVAQPMRKPAPRILPIRDGHFELPGCIPGRVYPVLLLDAERGLAAVTELRVATTNESPPTVRLDRCGSAAVRFVEGALGRPLADRRPSVWYWLSDDRPAGTGLAGDGPWSNPIEASWVDPRHFLSGPVTDEKGVVALPGLIPGLQYQVAFSRPGSKTVYSQPFRVAPGESKKLPDIVAPSEPEISHDAEQPREKAAKQVEPREQK